MTGPDGRRAQATEYLDGIDAIVGALSAASAAGRTGTAWLMGGNVGALYFRNGRVVGAELEGAPWVRTMLVNSGRLTPPAWQEFAREPGEDRSRSPDALPDALGLTEPEWTALSREAIVEATFELLPPTRPDVDADMVFQPDEIPAWTGSGRPVEFTALLHEVSRRQSVLDLLAPVLTPESAVVRLADERVGPVQVSAPQWRFLSALSDRSTPRSVARRLGVSTFATTILAVQLVRLGMVGLRSASGAWRPPENLFPRSIFGAALRVADGDPTRSG